MVSQGSRKGITEASLGSDYLGFGQRRNINEKTPNIMVLLASPLPDVGIGASHFFSLIP